MGILYLLGGLVGAVISLLITFYLIKWGVQAGIRTVLEDYELPIKRKATTAPVIYGSEPQTQTGRVDFSGNAVPVKAEDLRRSAARKRDEAAKRLQKGGTP